MTVPCSCFRWSAPPSDVEMASHCYSAGLKPTWASHLMAGHVSDTLVKSQVRAQRLVTAVLRQSCAHQLRETILLLCNVKSFEPANEVVNS